MHTMYTDNFKHNLRMAVEFRDVTLEDLAQRTGILRPSISRLLTKNGSCTLDFAAKLAEGLSIPLPVLLESPTEFKNWLRSRLRNLMSAG